MKVKDAIKKLQALDPDAILIVSSDNFEQQNSDIEASSIHQFDEGSSNVKTFRDAFDGESYKKEVWTIVGGNKKVVKIS